MDGYAIVFFLFFFFWGGGGCRINKEPYGLWENGEYL